jgi:hypothetical protein
MAKLHVSSLAAERQAGQARAVLPFLPRRLDGRIVVAELPGYPGDLGTATGKVTSGRIRLLARGMCRIFALSPIEFQPDPDGQ